MEILHKYYLTRFILLTCAYKILVILKKEYKMFVGTIAGNLHETSLVLPGPPGGLKDLSILFISIYCLLGTSKM
jgi:hypothetical protein